MVAIASGRHGNAAINRTMTSLAMTSLIVVVAYVERGHVTVHSLVLVVANARLDLLSCKSSTAPVSTRRVLLMY